MAPSIRVSLSSALHSLQNPSSLLHLHRPLSASNPYPSDQNFDLDLNSRLERLLPPTDGPFSYLSLQWLQDAIAVSLFVYSSLSGLLPKLPGPCSVKDKALLETYLEDSVKLLDVCNGLKEVIYDLQHYVMLVRYAVRSADLTKIADEKKLISAKGALSECVDFMNARVEEINRQGHDRSKLETCSSLLRRMGEKVEDSFVPEASNSKAFFDEIYAAKVTTIFTCSVLATALSVQPTRALAMVPIVDRPGWAANLLKLQQKVNGAVEKSKADGKSILLEELDTVDTNAREALSVLGKFLDEKLCPHDADTLMGTPFSTLLKNAEDLQQGLSSLLQQIDELFRMLIAVRVGILDALIHRKKA